MTIDPKQDLLRRLADLEFEERDVSARRRKLHDRMAIFPSLALQEAERELSLYRRDLHQRLDMLRAELSAMRVAASHALAPEEAAAVPPVRFDEASALRWHDRFLRSGRWLRLATALRR